MYREKTGLNGPPVMWKCKNYSKYTYCTVVSILFFKILNDFFLQGLFFYGSACSKVSWGPIIAIYCISRSHSLILVLNMSFLLGHHFIITKMKCHSSKF